MPGTAEQPEYYAMLYDVESRASKPTIEIFVAVTPENELLGGVTFKGDAKHYNAGGTASTNVDSSGIRLLAVKPEARGLGVGKSLTKACLQRAVASRIAVILFGTVVLKLIEQSAIKRCTRIREATDRNLIFHAAHSRGGVNYVSCGQIDCILSAFKLTEFVNFRLSRRWKQALPPPDSSKIQDRHLKIHWRHQEIPPR